MRIDLSPSFSVYLPSSLAGWRVASSDSCKRIAFAAFGQTIGLKKSRCVSLSTHSVRLMHFLFAIIQYNPRPPLYFHLISDGGHFIQLIVG